MATKTTYFLPLDFNIYDDGKIEETLDHFGMAGMAYYIATIIYMANNGGKVENREKTYRLIAKRARTTPNEIKDFIEKTSSDNEDYVDMKLFTIVDGYITSTSLSRRLENITKKSEARSKSGKIGAEVKKQKAEARKKALDPMYQVSNL